MSYHYDVPKWESRHIQSKLSFFHYLFDSLLSCYNPFVFHPKFFSFQNHFELLFGSILCISTLVQCICLSKSLLRILFSSLHWLIKDWASSSTLFELSSMSLFIQRFYSSAFWQVEYVKTIRYSIFESCSFNVSKYLFFYWIILGRPSTNLLFFIKSPLCIWVTVFISPF